LDEHNRGKTTATKHLAPWIVAFSQEFSDLTDARRIERKLKSFKNRKILDRIVATGTIEMKI
jgi:predicted GIY-YIG superfamily endonuclease